MTNVTLIPGDGIGPEIAASLVDIFKAANVSIKFDIEIIINTTATVLMYRLLTCFLAFLTGIIATINTNESIRL